MKRSSTEVLRELFEDELKDIYWVEKELTKAILKTMENVSAQELKDALEKHLKETKIQIKRLEQVFDELGQEAETKSSKAMERLLEEAEDIINETEAGPMRDAGIITAVQKIKHYEIASYETLCSFAKVLCEDKIESLLDVTLQKEKNADALLSEIAFSMTNVETA